MSTPLDALAGVPNAAAPRPNLLTGGQPAAAHFEALKAAGVETIVDIRDPMEPRPFDEPALMSRLGLRYVNVPVTAGNLDDETMDRALGAIRAAGDRPVLLHCASGNRTGGPLIAHLMLDRGASEETAVETAVRAGLRSAEVLQWAVDYAHRKAAG